QSSFLTSVRVPEGVKYIGDKAFFRCAQLSEVTLPDSIVSIGESAFENCTSLRHITLPRCCRTLWQGAFRNCYSLQHIVLPGELQSIREGAFEGCQSLTEITIPDSVQELEPAVFRKCAHLEQVRLPSGLKELREQMFEGCRSLRQISIPYQVGTIGSKAFSGCRSLREAELPSMLTVIGARAFEDCRILRSIRFPEHLRMIGDHAFQDCGLLGEVQMSPMLRRIRAEAFRNCISLREMLLPDEIEVIEDAAFRDCKSLRSIRIPPALGMIGDDCFGGTPWLEEQKEEMVIVGDGVLVEYRGQAAHVTLPESVHYVLEHAFPKDSVPQHLTAGESVRRMGWEFIPGLTLTLCRNACSVTVRMDETHSIPGRDEQRVLEFWETKRAVRRHMIFFDLKDPMYKLPLAVLMYLSEPEDEFFAAYMQRNAKDAIKYLITQNDTENLEKLLQRGFVREEHLDELVEYAIRYGQQSGSLEPQLLLMGHKSRTGHYQSLDAIFHSEFDL
ncbi:MAG: leucine-rich repeat domain-containing protein, partial [Oscillospiraceae bacterium]|nr:leucine-rich repeat domain-containing protein [Oscillospiraceae bacterium]